MEVSAMKALLDKAHHLKPPKRERTLFDIGARGYFENPTSELLAFFLDPSAEHGFAGDVLKALMETLPQNAQPPVSDWFLTRSPWREWGTSGDKRIDLVLESERWALVIENKVYHGLLNDFANYTHDAQVRLSWGGTREVLRVVLSPHGEVPAEPGWLGLRYADLLEHLKVAVGNLYAQCGENKWLLFLREFVLHLENLTVTDSVTEMQQQYVLEHLGDIEALNNAKNDALLRLRQRLQASINDALIDLGLSINTCQESWSVGPAFRFVPNGWKGSSSVVVFLPKERPGTVRVQPYIDKQNGDWEALEQHGFSINQFNDHGAVGNYYIFFYDIPEMNWEAVEKAAAGYLRAIIKMEIGWQQEAVSET